MHVDALDRVLYLKYGAHVKEVTVRIGKRSDNGEPYLRFRTADGKYKKVCLKALAKRLEYEVVHGGGVSRPIRWESAVEKFLARCSRGCENRNGRPKSKQDQWREESVLRRLVARFPGRPVHSTTERELLEFVSERRATRPRGKERPYATGSINREVAVITRFFSFLEQEEHVVRNPARRLKQKPPHNSRSHMAPTVDELKVWRNHIPAEKAWARDFFDIAVNTGMRAGEILGLKPEHCRSQQRMVFLQCPKEGRPATIPLNAIALAVIERRLVTAGQWLFERGDGSPYRVYQVHVVLKRARDRAGIRLPYYVHDLRRAFGTMAYAHAGLLEVQRLLRHSTPEVTRRYINVPDQTLQETVERVGATLSLEQTGNILTQPSAT
jgi:integrase